MIRVKGGEGGVPPKGSCERRFGRTLGEHPLHPPSLPRRHTGVTLVVNRNQIVDRRLPAVALRVDVARHEVLLPQVPYLTHGTFDFYALVTDTVAKML